MNQPNNVFTIINYYFYNTDYEPRKTIVKRQKITSNIIYISHCLYIIIYVNIKSGYFYFYSPRAYEMNGIMIIFYQCIFEYLYMKYISDG